MVGGETKDIKPPIGEDKKPKEDKEEIKPPKDEKQTTPNYWAEYMKEIEEEKRAKEKRVNFNPFATKVTYNPDTIFNRPDRSENTPKTIKEESPTVDEQVRAALAKVKT